MPKVDELDGCLAADRTHINKRVEQIGSKKRSTRVDLYRRALKLRRMIDNEVSISLSTKEMAAIVGVAESHLSRVFKSIFNIPIKQYIIERRMAEARHLLLNSEKSLIDISFTIGYESYNTFSNLFKTVHKMAPGEYRKKYKN